MIETNAPREIHVDIRSEYQKAKDRKNAPPAAATAATATAATATTAEQQQESESTEVYVKLKSYNNASNLKIHTSTNEEKTHKFADSIIDKDNQSSSTKTSSSSNHNKILREKSNRYSYRGQIKDFDEHHKTFLADRRSASSATTATTTATTTTPTATTTTPATTATPVGYAEFKKQQMRKSAL
jgi:small nuclear ribonucleoprotein (snRNP)-like protein